MRTAFLFAVAAGDSWTLIIPFDAGKSVVASNGIRVTLGGKH